MIEYSHKSTIININEYIISNFIINNHKKITILFDNLSDRKGLIIPKEEITQEVINYYYERNLMFYYLSKKTKLIGYSIRTKQPCNKEPLKIE